MNRFYCLLYSIISLRTGISQTDALKPVKQLHLRSKKLYYPTVCSPAIFSGAKLFQLFIKPFAILFCIQYVLLLSRLPVTTLS
jgi:hypothetical protein